MVATGTATAGSGDSGAIVDPQGRLNCMILSGAEAELGAAELSAPALRPPELVDPEVIDRFVGAVIGLAFEARMAARLTRCDG
jgi:hypothetical protein